MPKLNGLELTWEDLDALASTKMSAEELKSYCDAAKKDFNVMADLSKDMKLGFEEAGKDQ